MARRNQSQARERARQNKRRMDADRAAHDAAMEAAATKYFEGEELRQQADDLQHEAVLELRVTLNEPGSQVGALLDISESEVAALLKRARAAAPSEPPAPPAEHPDHTDETSHG